jgi:hypothetical protein
VVWVVEDELCGGLWFWVALWRGLSLWLVAEVAVDVVVVVVWDELTVCVRLCRLAAPRRWAANAGLEASRDPWAARSKPPPAAVTDVGSPVVAPDVSAVACVVPVAEPAPVVEASDAQPPTAAATPVPAPSAARIAAILMPVVIDIRVMSTTHGGW